MEKSILEIIDELLTSEKSVDWDLVHNTFVREGVNARKHILNIQKELYGGQL